MPCGWVNVQPSAALGGRCSRRLCTRFLRHVAGERHKARPEVLGGVLQKVRVDIASHDARALFQEPLRDGKTDARCRARDQRALFRKTSAHYPVSSMNRHYYQVPRALQTAHESYRLAFKSITRPLDDVTGKRRVQCHDRDVVTTGIRAIVDQFACRAARRDIAILDVGRYQIVGLALRDEYRR